MKLKVKIPSETKVTVYGYTLDHKGRATRALATEIGNMILSYVEPKPLSKNWTGKLETVTLYIVPEGKCLIEAIDRPVTPPEEVTLQKTSLGSPPKKEKTAREKQLEPVW